MKSGKREDESESPKKLGATRPDEATFFNAKVIRRIVLPKFVVAQEGRVWYNNGLN